MKKLYLFIYTLICLTPSLFAQSWNTTGNGNITTANFLGTTTPTDLIFKINSIEYGRLKSSGSWRFGSLTNNATISKAGVLTFTGTGAYLVVPNHYIFQSAANQNYGLYYNQNNTRYEFRNSNASPVFSVNTENGNSVFAGSITIGSSYTLPAADGTNGQVLTTNGNGQAAWLPAAGYNAGNGIAISGTTISNTAADQVVVLNGDGGTTVSGNYPNFTVSSQAYTAGSGISVNDGVITNTATETDPKVQVTNTGSVPKWNGTALVDGTIYDNDSIGIGTTTPAALLDVNGDAKINGITVGKGSGNIATNTTNGVNALSSNTTGNYNTAIGNNSLSSNTTGSNNVANGAYALAQNVTGNNNIAIGAAALSNSGTGVNNVAIGYLALTNNSTGSNNTCVGYFSAPQDGTVTNYTGIGYNIGSGASASNMVELGNGRVTVIRGNVNFSTYSDGRIKNNIKNNVPGLAFINLLNPVTYNISLDKETALIYKNDKRKTSLEKNDYAGSRDIEKQLKTGFVAQEVEAAAKKVNYDFSGVVKPQNDNDLYSLRYAEFVVPLVKAVQELSTMNDAKNKSIDSLRSATASQQKINESLQQQIDELKAMIQQNKVVANTDGEINIQTIDLKGAISLEQNIPNPFANATVIAYNLPVNDGNAYINFYSNNGMLLKSVKLAGQGKGNITLKASGLPSAIYKYTLMVDGKLIDTKQMILTR